MPSILDACVFPVDKVGNWTVEYIEIFDSMQLNQKPLVPVEENH